MLELVALAYEDDTEPATIKLAELEQQMSSRVRELASSGDPVKEITAVREFVKESRVSLRDALQIVESLRSPS